MTTREDALYELERCKSIIQNSKMDWLDERDIPVLDRAIEALEKQKIGFWVRQPHPNWGKWGVSIARCSECGFFGGTGIWNYCPNCGAKMVKKGDNDVH